jgi:hypothetical protein
MKNPHQQRRIWIFTAVCGVVVIALLFVLKENPRTPWLFPTLAGVGLTAVIFGSLFAKWAYSAARLRTSLVQGKDVLGRWRVDAGTWQQFVTLNTTFSYNIISPREKVPPQGVEVIVGSRGIMVGSQVQTFNHSAKVNGVVRNWGGDWTLQQISLGGDAPCCLYLYARMRGQHGAPIYCNLIFPVSRDAILQARAALNYFQQMLDALK